MSRAFIAIDTQNLSFLLPAHKYYTMLKKKFYVMIILILIIIFTQQNSLQSRHFLFKSK